MERRVKVSSTDTGERCLDRISRGGLTSPKVSAAAAGRLESLYEADEDPMLSMWIVVVASKCSVSFRATSLGDTTALNPMTELNASTSPAPCWATVLSWLPPGALAIGLALFWRMFWNR